MEPVNQNRKGRCSSNESFASHYSSPLEERVEILAKDPYRFYLSQNCWIYRDERRIELLDRYLEEAVSAENYKLCQRIREVQRMLLQKLWRAKNPVKIEQEPLPAGLIISDYHWWTTENEVKCDLTSDSMQVNKLLSQNKGQKTIKPLVLRPEHTDIPVYVNLSLPFSLEMVCVAPISGYVECTGIVSPSTARGFYIQSFVGYSFMVFAPRGFIKKNGIKRRITTIVLKESAPY